MRLTEADNVEVHPCSYVHTCESNFENSYYEIIDDLEDGEEPFCWTVYLHFPGEGPDAVADCPTEEIANELAAILLPLCGKR